MFGSLDLDEVTAAFAGEPDVFWAPVNSIEDVLEDPQLRPGGAVVEVPERDGERTRTMVSTPVDFSRTAWRPRRVAPDIGEHTREVLAGLGYDEAAIDALIAAGVVGA